MSPGIFYYPAARKERCFRISISNLDEQEIREGIRRLGRAIRRTATAWKISGPGRRTGFRVMGEQRKSAVWHPAPTWDPAPTWL